MNPEIKALFKRNRLRSVARSCRCQSGHIHDSRGEAGYCDSLLLLQKDGTIKEYSTQVTFDLRVKGKLITRHRVDFLVIPRPGVMEVHEYKGVKTEVWLIKRNLFEACYPKIPYHVINDCSERVRAWKRRLY